MSKEDKRAAIVLLGGVILGFLLFGYHIIKDHKVPDNPYTETGEVKPGWGLWI